MTTDMLKYEYDHGFHRGWDRGRASERERIVGILRREAERGADLQLRIAAKILADEIEKDNDAS